MKKSRKFFVSMASLGILLNNVTYATTEIVEKENSELSTKYIFMGIAALVIILLLFLGYKMDSKGNETQNKVPHKTEKMKKKLTEKAEEIKQNTGVYEDDNVAYEDDEEIFSNEDLNDSIEYKEDDEDSLYSTSFDNRLEDDEEKLSTSETEEELGEEFDTSIIDGLDHEKIPESTETRKTFDETMLFNTSDFSSTGSSLENEIDKLDNIDDSEIGLLEDNTNNDLFINELKKYEEPASSFKGFSVAQEKEEKIEEVADKTHSIKTKKYKKTRD